MRTTVTLTNEAADLIEQVRAETNASFKDVVNEAILRGLAERRSPAFTSATFAMGQPAVDLDHALQVAAALDDAESLRVMGIGQ